MAKNDIYILSIVGLVAFVAIAIMIIDGNATNRSYDDLSYTRADETGLAANTGGNTGRAQANSCTDSDGGYNYSVPGKVNLVKNKRLSTYTDTCFDSVVKEYACGRSAVTSRNYSCPYGCSNGACLNAPLSVCTDSDGRNTSTLGYVSGYLRGTPYTRYDYCTEAVLINEYYCYSTGTEVIPTTRQATCPYGCVDGRCSDVRPTTMWCNDTDYDNRYKIGHVVGMTPNGSYYYTDSCDVNTLTEYYCQNGYFSSKKYTCEFNNNEDGYCVDARCIPSYCNDAYILMEPGTTYTVNARYGEVSFRILNWSDSDSRLYLEMTTDETVSSWLVEGDIFTVNGQDFYAKDLFISNIGESSASLGLCFGPELIQPPICVAPACVGAYDTGIVDQNGCPIYNCTVCPMYAMPAPGWCENGTIVQGTIGSDGCQGAPICMNDTPKCIDTDGGRDYYVKGSIRSVSVPMLQYDKCGGIDGQRLHELYCNGENIQVDPFVDCTYGCSDGACLRVAPQCYDSDPQDDPYTRGYATIDNGKTMIQDQCGYEQGYVSDTMLIQSYCDGYRLKVNEFYDCQYGCSEGACINMPAPPTPPGVPV